MKFFYIINLLNRQFSSIPRYLSRIFACSAFLFLISNVTAPNTLASFEADYERIEIIHRQIEYDSNAINVYSETLKVRNAFFRLIYGSGDDFRSETIMYYSKLIAENSLKNDIDPMLILAVIATESSFRRGVVSPVGAIGLMQLMPSTARYISEKTGIPGISSWRQLFNSATNISLGTAYLAYLIKLTGSVEQALVAYNIGPTVMFADIRAGRSLPMDYVYNVMNKYNEIKSFDTLQIL